MTALANDLDLFIEQWRPRIDTALRNVVPKVETAYKRLHDAANYALFTGGKRLRPLIALATAASLGTVDDRAVIPACALEMVHTYSLIHDDLPAMDNDDVRRGLPTVHRKFSEGEAILAGDYLLTRAFELLSTAPGLSAEARLRLIQILGHKAGGPGMIGGQIMDIEAEGEKVDFERVQEIHRRKTGALLTASILFGGVTADLNDEELEELDQIGEQLGLAFQAIDDVLDVTASLEKKGRKVASDVANDKSTMVSLLGVDGARDWARNLLLQAQLRLKSLVKGPSLLSALATRLVDRET